MFRQSSSRNSRTKGIRVKHILQICLLLGVCFWLIYQVKHSHDKKKEFDEDGVRISSKTLTGNDLLKFGRKELPPRLEKLNEKHVEEDEEEAGVEDQHLHDEVDTKESERHEDETEEEDLEEEESKHDEKEQEEEESKNGETEDGDEIDEHDQDKADQIEDFVDEERVDDDKDGELTESEEKEGQVENDNSSDTQGHEENGHEAREEQYKGDDASSAVTHDTQVITTGSKNLSSVTSSENSEMKVSEIGNGQKNTSVTLGEGQMAGNDVLNVTAYKEEVNNSSTYKPEETFHLNSTMATELNDSTQVSTERNNNSTGENVVTTELVFLQNGTESLPEIKLYNVTVDLTSGEGTTLHPNATTSGGDQSDSNSTDPSRMEKFDGSAAFINSSNHSGFPLSENVLSFNTTVEAENSTSGYSTREHVDPTQSDKSDTSSESDETNEGSLSSSDENIDAVQHKSMDSSIARDEENHIDLDILPESKTEDGGNDDAAAE